MYLRTRQRDTLDPAAQQHFHLEDVLLVIFILNMDWKPNVVEFFILGPSMARMPLSRLARQRMVGPAITTTTPESRTDWYKETCTGRSERKGLNCCQVHLNPDSICSLAHFSYFLLFFLAVWRPDSSNCPGRDGGWVYRQHLTVRTHAHFFSLRPPARQMWSHGWLSAWRFVCVPQKSFSPLVMSLLNVSSTQFPQIFSSLTASLTPRTAFTDATDWNQSKHQCNSAQEWTVWPSGRSDPKHRLRAPVLHRC